MRRAHRTLHPALCTLHLAPYTLHPTPCTLHPTLCTQVGERLSFGITLVLAMEVAKVTVLGCTPISYSLTHSLTHSLACMLMAEVAVLGFPSLTYLLACL